MTIGGYNKKVVTDPDEIIWQHSYCDQHWEIYVQSIKFADTMIVESDFGLRARVSVEEKGIIVQQSLWPPIQEILTYKNDHLVCKEGDPKTKDFEHMRSYCYYNGNCLNLALESLLITLPSGKELEIVKA